MVCKHPPDLNQIGQLALLPSQITWDSLGLQEWMHCLLPVQAYDMFMHAPALASSACKMVRPLLHMPCVFCAGCSHLSPKPGMSKSPAYSFTQSKGLSYNCCPQ